MSLLGGFPIAPQAPFGLNIFELMRIAQGPAFRSRTLGDSSGFFDAAAQREPKRTAGSQAF